MTQGCRKIYRTNFVQIFTKLELFAITDARKVVLRAFKKNPQLTKNLESCIIYFSNETLGPTLGHNVKIKVMQLTYHNKHIDIKTIENGSGVEALLCTSKPEFENVASKRGPHSNN